MRANLERGGLHYYPELSRRSSFAWYIDCAEPLTVETRAFPKSEHIELLKRTIRARLKERGDRTELVEEYAKPGFNGGRWYEFLIRPKGSTVLPAGLQIPLFAAERFEQTRNAAEVNALVDECLDKWWPE